MGKSIVSLIGASVLAVSLPILPVSANSFHSHGATLTNGMNINAGSLLSIANNPAAGEVVLGSKNIFRMGYFSSAGFSMELGDVSNFEDELDELIDLVDDGVTDLNSAEEQMDRFNALLPVLGDAGYIQMQTGAYLPGMPMLLRTKGKFGGVWSLEAYGQGQARLRLLDSPLNLNEARTGFETDSAVYLKSALETRVSVGFSRPVWGRDLGKFKGNLLAGVKLNYIGMKLSKQIIGLANLDGEEVADVIADEYENNQVTTSAASLDFGIMWAAQTYQIGASWKNINEPEFDYGDIGVNCATLSNGTSRDNCFVAQSFAFGNDVTPAEINATETHVRNALVTVDASYLVLPTLQVSVAYDLAEYNDPVGGDYQWATFAMSHYPKNRIFPAWRLGYRVNQVGSELSSASLGTTILGVFNLDLSVGLEETESDGSSIPRTAAFNIGFEQKF